MTEPVPELALAAIRDELARRGRRFALVGGLAVSVRESVLLWLARNSAAGSSRSLAREHAAAETA